MARLAVIGLSIVTVISALVGPSGEVHAQAESYSASIRAGDCASAGAVVAPLIDATTPEGNPVGSTAARNAATSYTSVPTPIDALVASDHALTVSAGNEVVACGEIGGVYAVDGSLAIVLHERNGSGANGIAYLAPGVADPSQTGVSLFVAGLFPDVGAPTPESARNAGADVPKPVDDTDAAVVETVAAEPPSVPRASDPGTRDSPLPIGTAADIGAGWIVSVVDVVPDGTALVLAENQFNDPPEPGFQFFLVTISATYEGDGSSQLLAGLAFSVVGESSVSYSTFDPGCGVIPNPVPTTEVFTGGTIVGNVCWSVRTSDVDSLAMYSEDFVTFDRDRRVWFAVR